jgi:hypothetical protein
MEASTYASPTREKSYPRNLLIVLQTGPGEYAMEYRLVPQTGPVAWVRRDIGFCSTLVPVRGCDRILTGAPDCSPRIARDLSVFSYPWVARAGPREMMRRISGVVDAVLLARL